MQLRTNLFFVLEIIHYLLLNCYQKYNFFDKKTDEP